MSADNGYAERVLDRQLAEALASSGAVVIEGAKAAGKTETGRHQCASEVLFDVDQNARDVAQVDPFAVLEGATPRLLDEWQLVPQLWNATRRAVDSRRSDAQFVLTGSATPADDMTHHSGAGRFTRLRIRPMSLAESGRSTAAVSLQEVLAGKPVKAADPKIGLRDLVEAVCRGGWPASRTRPLRAAMASARSYVEQVARGDIPTADGVKRDPIRMTALMRSLARNESTPAADTKLAADTGLAASAGQAALHRDTVGDYVDALERLMVAEPQPAWTPNLRSRARLRNKPIRRFVDPSVAVAAIGATPAGLLRDLEYFGLLFESLVVRDLRVYSGPLGGQVWHYRDSAGLEVDAIVTAWDGSWGAFEVKLGASAAVLDEAAGHLKAFAERVDTRLTGEPAALCVITGTGYAYRRPDGVAVIPIGTLGP
jgi:predicted AAA+ superfamily ATPase